ncbi:unnamed protein product [Rotaria magnacalcarata]|uniref:Uncharacterized protein n=2 Tax=Rotaria magnacalcarata TaxID=392030 RepID=A0A816NXW7_9BILA|nr:unnamed protein product [Rotaria magnacalcarata]CAF2041774.1 unnamed protein product [Rotaria magnacalcarata]CAF4127793.1 unnamed protein product [Rotaria magnacalcarata]CAF4298064.1 unnamed protein product [Rotaria magnacalcarata]
MAHMNLVPDKLCKNAETSDFLNVDEPELIDLTESSNLSPISVDSNSTNNSMTSGSLSSMNSSRSSISSPSPINWSDQDDSFEDNIPLIDLTESSQDSYPVSSASRSLSLRDLSFSSMSSSTSLFLPPPPSPILNHLPMFRRHQKHILQVNIPLIDLTQSSPIPSPVHI